MVAIIEAKRKDLDRVCRELGVARLELFGSATGTDFDPDSSDLDFVVDFGATPVHLRFDRFFELQRALAELYGRPMDLTEDGAVQNPFVLRRINESRRVVYGP